MKYNKRLTVRISNPRFWYSKHLNETFDVLKTPDEDDYVLTEDYIKGEDATKRLIKKCDCIETESPSDSEAVEGKHFFIGKSVGQDFEEKTWTFKMQSDFYAMGGNFKIIPL